MRSVKLAVVKPDHLGDFVLALPAIRTLQSHGFQITLFLASDNLRIARHYFPDIELIALDLPYLRHNPGGRDWAKAYRHLGMLRRFDFVLFLRRDAFLTPSNFSQWTDYAFFIEDRLDLHQSRLESSVISNFTGPYDIESTFFAGRQMQFPDDPNSIIFSVGAGFPFKKWSPFNWAELGQLLLKKGVKVRILSGPAEISECRLIARACGLDDNKDVFVGTDDFGALEQWIASSDLVIAADGGSAHLCSTRKPILGIFGPSPIHRYAPIGRSNRILTRELPCSPCVGFHQKAINACMSRDCLYGLRPEHVVAALDLPSALPGETCELVPDGSVKVKFGVSAEPS